METFIILDYTKEREIPEEFQSNDNRYPEILAKTFLEKYTKQGDKIIDIFAGLGTSLFVAEELGRIPFGIEYDQRRFDYIRSKTSWKENIIHGDARKLDSYDFPTIDFAITSPPYMHKNDPENPLTAYTEEGTYQQYLVGLREIYRQLKKILKFNAFIVIEVSNLKGKEVTTLAWDIANEISKVLHFDGEVVVGWKGENTGEGTYGYGYDHSYCLIFRNKA